MKSVNEAKPARLAPGQRQFIQKVLDVYRRVKYASPITALNLDEVSARRSYKWTPAGCHFQVDIDHAVRDAIKGQPDLKAAWTQLVEDAENLNILTEPEIRLIRALVPVLQARGLSPETYFRPVRG